MSKMFFYFEPSKELADQFSAQELLDKIFSDENYFERYGDLSKKESAERLLKRLQKICQLDGEYAEIAKNYLDARIFKRNEHYMMLLKDSTSTDGEIQSDEICLRVYDYVKEALNF